MDLIKFICRLYMKFKNSKYESIGYEEYKDHSKEYDEELENMIRFYIGIIVACFIIGITVCYNYRKKLRPYFIILYKCLKFSFNVLRKFYLYLNPPYTAQCNYRRNINTSSGYNTQSFAYPRDHKHGFIRKWNTGKGYESFVEFSLLEGHQISSNGFGLKHILHKHPDVFKHINNGFNTNQGCHGKILCEYLERNTIVDYSDAKEGRICLIYKDSHNKYLKVILSAKEENETRTVITAYPFQEYVRQRNKFIDQEMRLDHQ